MKEPTMITKLDKLKYNDQLTQILSFLLLNFTKLCGSDFWKADCVLLF